MAGSLEVVNGAGLQSDACSVARQARLIASM
jgi:hypothetical protein